MMGKLVLRRAKQTGGPPSTDGGLVFRLQRGLDLPIDGAPDLRMIERGPDATACAVVAADFNGLKPRMRVEVGDTVRAGEPLFSDKRFEGVVHTAPASGRVQAINRGARRVLESVVIAIDASVDGIDFPAIRVDDLPGLSRDQVVDILLESGLWTALRTRPYSKTPDPATAPHSIFITAMDTRPLAPDPALILGEAAEDFATGAALVAKLTDGPTFVAHRYGASLPRVDAPNVALCAFDGPHPAGLAGTHIHLLDPVGEAKTVWHLGYQDVIAIGALFRTGKLPTDRVVALAGPAAQRPRLMRVHRGASLLELAQGETKTDAARLVSGDVLSGRHAEGPFAYLGAFANQITLLPEHERREFVGWLVPSRRKFATARVHLSSFLGLDRIGFHTSLNGSPRAMVPFGLYEEVMPLDILATQLLRAILVADTETAQRLGVLELDEEDLALSAYVCPSKYEYGLALRANLETIETDG